MTVAEMLARIRAAYHEASAGYASDNDIYRGIDNGQMAVTQMLLPLKHRSLYPILKQADIVFVSGTQEYALPADFLAEVVVQVAYAAGGANATFMPYAIANWRNATAYLQPTTTAPAAYLLGGNIGFYPVPDNNKTQVKALTYYYKARTVDSTHELTLGEETHLAIMEYALYLVFTEDKNHGEAGQHLNNFVQRITALING